MSAGEKPAEQGKASFEAAFRLRMLIGVLLGGVPTVAASVWLFKNDEPIYGMLAVPVLFTTPLMAALGAGIAILCGTRRQRR